MPTWNGEISLILNIKQRTQASKRGNTLIKQKKQNEYIVHDSGGQSVQRS